MIILSWRKMQWCSYSVVPAKRQRDMIKTRIHKNFYLILWARDHNLSLIRFLPLPLPCGTAEELYVMCVCLFCFFISLCLIDNWVLILESQTALMSMWIYGLKRVTIILDHCLWNHHQDQHTQHPKTGSPLQLRYF